MSEGKSHPLPRKSLLGIIVRTGTAVSLATTLGIGTIHKIQEITQNTPDTTNITENLNGFDLYIREALTFPLPDNVTPAQIRLDVSEGKPATVKNPNPINIPYYNTVTLTPDRNGKYKIQDNDIATTMFDPNKLYSPFELSKLISHGFDLSWLSTEFIMPRNRTFVARSSSDNILKINSAINESIEKGYENPTTVNIQTKPFSISSIICNYNINGPDQLVYCAYT